MIRDNLIDTILSRAFDYIDNNDYIGAVKIYARAWKRVCDNISKDNIKSIEEYYKKYDSDEYISDWVCVYIDALQCCFEETGNKKYLEEIIDFKEKYSEFFNVDKYFSKIIIQYESEAKFYLGKKQEAIDELKKLIKMHKEDEEIYIIISRLYTKINMFKEAKEVLKEGIKKCEFNAILEEMLGQIEKEEKRSKK